MNNSRHEHKRIKHGQLPGDVSKKIKIKMRETKGDVEVDYGFNIQIIPSEATKSYRKELAKKGRAVLKERTKGLIKESNIDDVL